MKTKEYTLTLTEDVLKNIVRALDVARVSHLIGSGDAMQMTGTRNYLTAILEGFNKEATNATHI